MLPPASAGDAADRRPRILVYGVVLAVCYLITGYGVISRLPPFSEQQTATLLRIPRSIDDSSQVYRVLCDYVDTFYAEVLLCFIMAFYTIQTLAIPGSIPLTVLGGALFGKVPATAAACTCTALGSTSCYWISWLVGSKIVRERMPSQFDRWSALVHENRDSLVRYIAVLRLTPIFPGWLLNIMAPHIGIPAVPFLLGTFIGIAPLTYVYCMAGETLRVMSVEGDQLTIFSPQILTTLAAIGVALLLPSILSSFRPAINSHKD